MEELLTQIARQVRDKYFGKYRGFVADVEDPETRGRLRLRIPSVLGDSVSGWALPCVPFGGAQDMGTFLVPEVGACVWVEFEEGDLAHPIWTGTFWSESEGPPTEAAVTPPTRRVVKTKAGHVLEFDDTEGEERITLSHPQDASLEIDADGTVAVTDANGATVTLDANAGEVKVEDANGNSMTMSSSGTTVVDGNGNKIEMAASGVTVKGAQIVIEGSQVMLGGAGGEPVIKGTSFLTLFATHIHPTGVGPSGPPIPQGEMSSLSTKVMSA